MASTTIVNIQLDLYLISNNNMYAEVQIYMLKDTQAMVIMPSLLLISLFPE